MKKIMLVFGTRPEAIKMAPLVLELKKRSKERPVKIFVCVTAQHRQMLDQVLELFKIVPDFDLSIMSENQSLCELTGKIIQRVNEVVIKAQPDIVLVHGDTTTTFGAALSAYYCRKAVGHIEAGLRTFDKYNPFPEEINRHLTASLTDIHFAPTTRAKDNLLMEGIDKNRIHVTGNTVIDALLHTVKILESDIEIQDSLNKKFDFIKRNNNNHRMILVTGHRRESFGKGFEDICKAIATLAKTRPNVSFVYPVHLNPNVQEPVHRLIGKLKNVYLLKPLEYMPFVFLMNKSTLILTDSGGVQEEAPSLGKPVLVMREVTERPEAIEAGTVRLVGTNPEKIIKNVIRLLDNSDEYEKMSFAHNPYGDGKASFRIADEVLSYINACNGPGT